MIVALAAVPDVTLYCYVLILMLCLMLRAKLLI